MSDKDKLIGLIDDFTENLTARDLHSSKFDSEFADHLIANGVICPPVKIGDSVFYICQDGYEDGGWFICEEKVIDVSKRGFYINEFLDGSGADILEPYEQISVNVFLTEEEADERLKGLKNSES